MLTHAIFTFDAFWGFVWFHFYTLISDISHCTHCEMWDSWYWSNCIQVRPGCSWNTGSTTLNFIVYAISHLMLHYRICDGSNILVLLQCSSSNSPWSSDMLEPRVLQPSFWTKAKSASAFYISSLGNVRLSIWLQKIIRRQKSQNSSETQCHGILVSESRYRGFQGLESQGRGFLSSEKFLQFYLSISSVFCIEM